MANQFETQGMFSWFELITDNKQEAINFYKELIGWEFEQDSNNPNYTLIKTKNSQYPTAGILEKKDLLVANKNISSHWGCYITVNDIESIMNKVETLGGKIIVPCTKIPKVGVFSVIQDQQGAVVSFMEYHLEV